ncbi:MAG: L-threonine 3-dehydrogenase [Pseudomonadota bacterium]
MKNILVMGASGQIGSELTCALRKEYGDSNVVASDIKKGLWANACDEGPFEYLNATEGEKILDVVKKYNIDTIFNLVALLSATAEEKPQLAWDINVGSLVKILEIARENNCAVFTPSSIGAFGPSTPKDKTPQLTIQRPSTIYGVTKVSGELLCDYYYQKFGVDTRGLRYPGIISNVALPGGGTTDYAVHIYYEAIKNKKYTSFIDKGTFIDMMYMPDACRAAMELMEADPVKLNHRNAYNVTAMSFEPEMLAREIKKHIPDFVLSYNVDPIRQRIANSWPDSIDDTAAKEDWGWKAEFDLIKMTEDMIRVLKEKL